MRLSAVGLTAEPLQELDLQGLLADQAFQRRNPRLVLLGHAGRRGGLVEDAGLPDPGQDAGEIVSARRGFPSALCGMRIGGGGEQPC